MEEKITPEIRGLLKSAVATLVVIAGIVLAFLALYIPPEGVIDYSVIAILAELLVFAGSLFGIATSYDLKLKKFTSQMNKEISKIKEPAGTNGAQA